MSIGLITKRFLSKAIDFKNEGTKNKWVTDLIDYINSIADNVNALNLTIPTPTTPATTVTDETTYGISKIAGILTSYAREDHTHGSPPPPATAIFTKYFPSASQTITSSGALTLAHGLGVIPTLIQVFLKCTTAEGGYSTGDTLPVSFTDSTGAPTGSGVSVVADSTNLNIKYGSAVSVWSIINKSTGASFSITNANWNAIFRAWA